MRVEAFRLTSAMSVFTSLVWTQTLILITQISHGSSVLFPSSAPSGLFNFKPSVRPVPLEAHIQGFPGVKKKRGEV